MVVTFNGGRFGNQLYYFLQAYKQNNKYKVRIGNSEFDKELPNLLELFKLLELYDLIDMDATNPHRINSYAQVFGSDFTPEELNRFIENRILKSSYFTDKLNNRFGLNDTDILLQIRCGDFLRYPRHNCFDRTSYLQEALKLVVNNDAKLVVQSDDIELCKKTYDCLFKEHFKEVDYYKGGNVLDDFIHLCSFKNKIIFNSTYAIWSCFVSNVIFKDSYQNIVCPNVFTYDNGRGIVSNRYNDKWKSVECKLNNI